MKRDKRWDLFLIPHDFELFSKEMLKDIYLKLSVNEDVQKAFRVIKRLMEYSYFEYEFYDVAASKAMLTSEMAMRKRYLEITSNEWKEKGPLYKLIDWMQSNYYFDVYNEYFLKHFRSIRNSMAHIKQYSFGGPMMNQWILHPMDLINDMYEDPNLRKERMEHTNLIQDKLDELLPNGTQVAFNKQTLILFNAWISIVNNKKLPQEITFYFNPIFEIFDQALKEAKYIKAAELSVTCNKVFIKVDSIIGVSASGAILFELSNLKKEVNQNRYD